MSAPRPFDLLGPPFCTHCRAPVIRVEKSGKALEDRPDHPRRGLVHECDASYWPRGESTRRDFMQRTDPVAYQQCRDAGRF